MVHGIIRPNENKPVVDPVQEHVDELDIARAEHNTFVVTEQSVRTGPPAATREDIAPIPDPVVTEQSTHPGATPQPPTASSGTPVAYLSVPSKPAPPTAHTPVVTN